jgi:hypothetical protein
MTRKTTLPRSQHGTKSLQPRSARPLEAAQIRGGLKAPRPRAIQKAAQDEQD